jgi:endonuclease/exonuclease/phosphatase family metal-dependent hydrolase
MANAMLVDKQLFCKPVLYEAHVFQLEDRGYRALSVWNLPMWWFQMSFMRPNYMIAIVSSLNDNTPTFLLVNVHLVVNIYNPARMKQVKILQEAIQKAQKALKISHVVLCGDFNTTPDSPEMRWLIDNGRYSDIGTLPTCADNRIDYVLTSGWNNNKSIIQESFIGCTDEPRCSDHFAVVYNSFYID